MSEDKKYPSIGQQAKNLANFSWELIQYIQNNRDNVLFVSDEVYKERVTICKSCDKYDELENRCTECGCYVPGKAKIILDSCPLKKWEEDRDSWEGKFEKITQKFEEENDG